MKREMKGRSPTCSIDLAAVYNQPLVLDHHSDRTAPITVSILTIEL
ncbi:MAG: hypothetical protein WBA57_08115 [Elainellaceae cyanobacterium]